MTPVRRELIESLAAEAPKPQAAACGPTNGLHNCAATGGALRPPPLPGSAARCRAYVRKVGPAISGQYGHNATFKVARIVWNDFGLDEADGYPILEEFNRTCEPPWDEADLRRKWSEAAKAGSGPRGRGFKLREGDWPGFHPGGHGRGDAWEPPGPHDVSFDRSEFREKSEAEPRFRFIPSDEFASGDYRPTWLIPGVLVRGQPGVIAGPSKGMKTSVLIDMAVSMAAGRPFLSKFDVPRPVRVAVVSGESGEHTLQETAHRICRARGVSLASLGAGLQWCFDLPSFPDLAGMAEFAERLLAFEAEFVAIDPVYMCLGEVDAKNLFEMGQAFRSVASLLLKAGVTPYLVHHANRLLKVGEAMELQHLAYSGLEQFCRQFLLLNRSEPYLSDGEHSLWVRVGGSAGHGGLWAVHVSEGVTDDRFEGRRWEVAVATADEVRTRKAGEREAEKDAAKRNAMRLEETKILNAIDSELAQGQPAATLTRLHTITLIDKRKLPTAIARLVEDRGIEEHQFEKASGKGGKTLTKCTGYRRATKGGPEPDLLSEV